MSSVTKLSNPQANNSTNTPTIEQIKNMNENELLELAHQLHNQGAKRRNSKEKKHQNLIIYIQKLNERLYNKGYRTENIINKSIPTIKPVKKNQKKKSKDEPQSE